MEARGEGQGQGRGGRGQNGNAGCGIERTVICAQSREEAAAVLSKANVGAKKSTYLLTALGWEQDLQAFAWAFEWARDRHISNVFHHTQYISVLGRRGKVIDAVEVFDQMQDAGLQSKIVTYNA